MLLGLLSPLHDLFKKIAHTIGYFIKTIGLVFSKTRLNNTLLDLNGRYRN